MPAHDQQVFQAAGDEQFAAAQETQVTGTQPGPPVVLDKGLGAGFWVAPIAQGDARASGPDFTDLIVRQRLRRSGFDDQHRVPGLADTATHHRTALPRLGTVLRQCRIIHPQRRNAVAAWRTGDEQGRFCQAVGGHEIVRREAARGELLGKPLQRVETDRLGTGIGHAPAAQVETLHGRVTDPFAAQPIGEIRATADSAAVFADCFEPTQGPGQEVGRRHQYAGDAAEHRLQQAANQPHVVVQRQPADDDVIGVQVDAEAMTDQQFVSDQVAVADLHALGQRGGAGGVLQEGNVIVLQRRHPPLSGAGRVEGINAQHWRRRFDGLQRLAQIAAGEQQARFGVFEDRQQALLMVATGGLRRIGRHGNHPGIEAAKERRDVIRAAGEQQHGAIPQRGLGLQGGGDGPGTQVQVAITQYHTLPWGVGEEAQGHPVRRQRGAALEGMSQGDGEFERVGHGGFLPGFGLQVVTHGNG
ncbi:hypothetical protein PFLU4_58640 [Pseudomonas fluorescens]|nr:hypothetical protein PFLU4_58640 [Pseudomonas fluorescens]